MVFVGCVDLYQFLGCQDSKCSLLLTVHNACSVSVIISDQCFLRVFSVLYCSPFLQYKKLGETNNKKYNKKDVLVKSLFQRELT